MSVSMWSIWELPYTGSSEVSFPPARVWGTFGKLRAVISKTEYILYYIILYYIILYYIILYMKSFMIYQYHY